MRTLAIVMLAAACGYNEPLGLPGEHPGNGRLIRRDENSPCTGSADYEADGKIDMLYQYIYDDLGRSARDFGKSQQTDLADEEYTYRWDHVDHLTELVQRVGGIEVSRTTSIFDTLGNELEMTTTFDYTPEEHYVEVIKNLDFDDHGRPRYSIRSYTGMPDVKTEYFRDETGRTVERRDDTGIDGTIDTTSYVVYDDVELKTTTTTVSTDGAHSLRTTRYNERMHPVSTRTERWLANGTFRTNEIRMAWDGDRNLAMTLLFNELEQTIYEYGYDCTPSVARTE